MEMKRKVRLEYGLDGENIQTREIHPEEPTSYRVDDTTTPGCFRLWYGKKTIIIPLRSLALVELDL